MLTAVYFKKGHLQISNLFDEIRPVVDELYRQYIEIDSIILYQEENFWCAKLYYYEKEAR
jgi:hypothetical protein